MFDCDVLHFDFVELRVWTMFGGDLLTVAVHLVMLVTQVRGDCRQIGVCSCETDEGVIDLSPLALDGDAMWVASCAKDRHNILCRIEISFLFFLFDMWLYSLGTQAIIKVYFLI